MVVKWQYNYIFTKGTIMEIGLSLACFYPTHPEGVVETAKSLGFNICELFINTYSELDRGYIGDFARKCEKLDMRVHSIHPFTSAIENYMFFSRYDRRVSDAKKLYSKYCEVARYLGAGVINIHGDRGLALNDFDEYVECLAPLAELSDKYGVTFAHENVFFNSINHPDIAAKLVSRLGNRIKFTFDIKQAHKGGSDPYELCRAMGKNIVNFHINDYDDEHICMLPGRGRVDYNKIFSLLSDSGYEGPALIEVYSSNYKDISEITRSAEFLRSFF